MNDIEIYGVGKKWALSVDGREILRFNSRASAVLVLNVLQIDGEVLGGESD